MKMTKRQREALKKLGGLTKAIFVINCLFFLFAKLIQGDFEFHIDDQPLTVSIPGMVIIVIISAAQLIPALLKKIWAKPLCIFLQCSLLLCLFLDLFLHGGGYMTTVEENLRILFWAWVGISVIFLFPMSIDRKYHYED